MVNLFMKGSDIEYPSLSTAFCSRYLLIIETNSMAVSASAAFPITDEWDKTRINDD